MFVSMNCSARKCVNDNDNKTITITQQAFEANQAGIGYVCMYNK